MDAPQTPPPVAAEVAPVAPGAPIAIRRPERFAHLHRNLRPIIIPQRLFQDNDDNNQQNNRQEHNRQENHRGVDNWRFLPVEYRENYPVHAQNQ